MKAGQCRGAHLAEGFNRQRAARCSNSGIAEHEPLQPSKSAAMHTQAGMLLLRLGAQPGMKRMTVVGPRALVPSSAQPDGPTRLDDVSQLLLLAEPRLQQGEEQLHELLAILLHSVVCRGTGGVGADALRVKCRPHKLTERRCMEEGMLNTRARLTGSVIRTQPSSASSTPQSTRQAGQGRQGRQAANAPRLSARASGAGSTGSRQPCSMARNSSLQGAGGVGTHLRVKPWGEKWGQQLCLVLWEVQLL